jgi:hypothetical protein
MNHSAENAPQKNYFLTASKFIAKNRKIQFALDLGVIGGIVTTATGFMLKDYDLATGGAVAIAVGGGAKQFFSRWSS